MPTPAPSIRACQAARSQQGGIVVYLALALVAFGVLAMAGASRFGSVTRGVLSPNCSAAARYMAESGVRYAMARLRSTNDSATLTALVTEMNNHGAYTVDASKGLSFTLSIAYNSGTKTAAVTSTGTSCTGLGNFFGSSTSAQAVSVNLPKMSDVIDFTNIADDFFTTSDLRGTTPITVDPATKTISFGNLSQTKEAAAIWYGGNATSGCLNGNCTMTNGFNAYFDVVWNSSSIADGLVFGVMSAETNTRNAVGGTTTQGELMGWGGPGSSGLGIRPPKIGVEFDTYYNSCGSTLTSPGSRCDPTAGGSNPDHMAYVFWGSASTLYDDNRHGAGNGGITEPVASNDPDGSGSGQFGLYYKSPATWLQGGTKYYVRHELTRLTTKSSSATDSYCYVLKTWVSSAAPSAAYKDVTTDYDATTNPPTMQQVVFLNADYHAKMNRIFFGWTEATGDYTQNILVGNFNLAFKKAQPTYGTAPSGASLYWPMYDNVGSGITDASGNGITGIIIGTAMWVPGVMNNNGAGLYFNGGTYAYASSASGTQLTSVGGVSLWFKMTASQTNVWLLHKGETSRFSECYGLYIDSSGYLRFRLRTGTGPSSYTEVSSTTRPVAGTWYHVAVTWQNASTPLAIYVNGTKEASVAAATAQSTASNLYLGAASASSTEFYGIIDEVYLYKQLLTQAGITALATGKP
ncbi:MAG: LamG domain-containing protein [Desulfovibrio sp.]|jgi:hypothetical protein|nr:LamG domain-containing protein [Desulfovibrio sp.]